MNISDALPLKIVIIGESAVGKTCLINAFKGNQFEELPYTVGVEFQVIHKNLNGQQYKINIWDTAGQEKYESMTSICLKNSDCIVVCFDLSKDDRVEIIKRWINMAATQVNAPIVLIGTKSDLDIQINDETKQELIQFTNQLKQQNTQFYMVSSKTQSFVNESFNFILNMAIKKKYEDFPSKLITDSFLINRDSQNQKNSKKQNNKSNCC